VTIPADQVQAARALYATGLFSQDEVAAKIGISRTSCQSILRGRGRHLEAAGRPVEPDPDPRWDGKPAWCRPCGAWVIMPCIACAARSSAGMAGPRSQPAEPETGPEIELRGAEAARYQQIRRRRIEAEAADQVFSQIGELRERPLGPVGRIDQEAADAIYRQLGG